MKASVAANFIWPEALTEERFGSFGYLMPLRPKGYMDMNDGNFFINPDTGDVLQKPELLAALIAFGIG